MAEPVEQSVDHWRERALAAERWRDEVWAPLNERLAADARAEDLSGELDRLRSGRVWRAAAPLRAAGSFAQRAKRRLRP